jgi:hypothetical protein
MSVHEIGKGRSNRFEADMIRVGVRGRITKGLSTGWFVLVQDDSANTGGYLILKAKSLDCSEGFDDWVENRGSLEQYSQVAGWQIAWLE